MLVLQLKQGERVFIGDKLVTITLIEVRRGQRARIGFEADKSLGIEREIVRKKRLEKEGKAA